MTRTKAVLLAIMMFLGWAVWAYGVMFSIAIVGGVARPLGAEWDILLFVSTLLLFVALFSRTVVLENSNIELKRLQAIQKIDGAIVLKRGPRGRFMKAEVEK